MSRSRKGGKKPGHELWSKRPLAGYSSNKENKKISHRIERARAKQKQEESP